MWGENEEMSRCKTDNSYLTLILFSSYGVGIVVTAY